MSAVSRLRGPGKEAAIATQGGFTRLLRAVALWARGRLALWIVVATALTVSTITLVSVLIPCPASQMPMSAGYSWPATGNATARASSTSKARSNPLTLASDWPGKE